MLYTKDLGVLAKSIQAKNAGRMPALLQKTHKITYSILYTRNYFCQGKIDRKIDRKQPGGWRL